MTITKYSFEECSETAACCVVCSEGIPKKEVKIVYKNINFSLFNFRFNFSIYKLKTVESEKCIACGKENENYIKSKPTILCSRPHTSQDLGKLINGTLKEQAFYTY